METLADSRCSPCRADQPAATADEIEQLLTQVPDWQIVQHEGADRLERDFTFRDFVEALNFANNIGRIAEIEGHHPALLVDWGHVTVFWWTHSLGGLHRNDFIMAAKTDRLYTPLARQQEVGR